MNVPPPRARLVLPGALLLSAALLSASVAESAFGGTKSGPQPTDPPVMVVTTDSSAYCRTLSDAIDAHGNLPREVRELKAQGDGMCDEGRVRGGIVRLRRALLILNKDPAPDSAAPP